MADLNLLNERLDSLKRKKENLEKEILALEYKISNKVRYEEGLALSSERKLKKSVQEDKTSQQTLPPSPQSPTLKK
jgi:hypothetical protein